MQISDLSFRRHVLVQALILIDFLLSLSPKAKEKWTGAPGTNRSVMYEQYTLSPEDVSFPLPFSFQVMANVLKTVWAQETRKAIEEYLTQGEGREGRFYYRMVDTVLARDKNWVRWKIESCPSIERPPVSTEEYLDAKSTAKKTFAPKRLRAMPLGALDLKFLSEAENLNGLEKLKNPDM